MTQKENLLIRVYELENELAVLNGKEAMSIEERKRINCFYREARESKVYELKSDIESLERRIAERKQEIEAEARKAEYLATEEGKESMEDALARREALCQDIDIHKEVSFSTINGAVKGLLGDHWSVLSLGDPTLRIGISDGSGKAIFGQSCEIRYEERSWPDGNEEFSINFGSCGSFGIMDGETAGSFARFHIDLGRLLSAETFLDWLKCAMRCYSNGLKSLYKELDAVNAWIKNPVA